MRLLGFGFLSWLVPFVIAVVIFPLKTSAPPLFESVMAVILAATTIVLFNRYARGSGPVSVRDAAIVGFVWLAVNWACDVPMFMVGPMRRSLASYAMDIGIAYVMIPVITAGAASLAQEARETHEARRIQHV